MPRPAVYVQHFLFCTGVAFADRTRPNRALTLDGVGFYYEVPRHTEFPFEPDELWFYTRMFSPAGDTGFTRPLTVRCLWLDSPGGSKIVWWRRVGRVKLQEPWTVADRTFAVRPHPELSPALFPGRGRYEFRLTQRIHGRRRILARDSINVEVGR